MNVTSLTVICIDEFIFYENQNINLHFIKFNDRQSYIYWQWNFTNKRYCKMILLQIHTYTCIYVCINNVIIGFTPDE